MSTAEKIIPMATRKTRAAARDLVRELADDHKYDPYGSGMNALGTVTEALWVLGAYVPADIATFQPWHAPEEEAVWVITDVESGHQDVEALEYFMYVLSRYIDIVRLAGRDY
jgi:hypothetical protein